ncbi:type IV conjugative transfer system protein TraL [Candidatus Fukatsuia symbiotica]|uniref:Protein TraL n=1 Tax=Candidatus Fukatsuia symbiotica TaxID=1878942 RepID=A0A2U8I7Q2_9GAMM|nr:type IV conjugative transfer system protein TraL [Candidatus Fukatsuia symbiotica]AWK15137.1 type IV conjugative transfer system protein TraL [Candidatus Fukatsuia symbiotica]MEA9443958.1 type IV conjugative transfer system protein TraL [Candidatus Fukatsuia symbiotica]
MTTEEDLQKYRFPKTLSEPRRLFGLPYDEALPSLPVFLWGIMVHHALFGMGMALVICLGIRTAKRGKGSMWLYNLLYWYFPGFLFRPVFKVIPDSSFRQWIK